MTFDQLLLFALVAGILAMLLWGRFRHDLVAACGVLAAVLIGLVPAEAAFSGFSSHAVVVVALVLVASRAFENAGVLGLIAGLLADGARRIPVHIAALGGIGAGLSAVINNVAALALLMPLDVQAARQAGRPPGCTLMPLSFATILGGMVTLIGTPPNIVAAGIREERLGEPYAMFDFTPVGLAVATAGVAFVAVVGWRLVPRREDKAGRLAREASFQAELVVPPESPAVGNPVGALDEEAERADVLLLGLIRGGRRHFARARLMPIEPGDMLIVEGSTDAIAAFVKAAGLQEAAPVEEAPAAEEPTQAARQAAEPAIVEAVVRADSRLVGRSARSFGLRARFGATLLGIARAGVVAREEVRDRAIQAGDLLLLTGRGAASAATLDLLGLLAVDRISVAPVRWPTVTLTVGVFAAAVAAASLGLLPFTIALAIAVAVYAATGIVPAREFYQQIDWSVIVMLACLLPIGSAFEQVGGTALIAGGIAALTQTYSPVVALVALMLVTMTLSDALNNVATIVIAGPIAVDLADRLAVNPDTFLMGVAIATSCAFLTPIGHKNNTLIMGPGGFRFADYWRMGLLLELVVLAVGVPMLLLVWPL